jgi:hypothetical protein
MGVVVCFSGDSSSSEPHRLFFFRGCLANSSFSVSSFGFFSISLSSPSSSSSSSSVRERFLLNVDSICSLERFSDSSGIGIDGSGSGSGSSSSSSSSIA